MSWFKIDDGFHSHPKVIQVGNAACGLFVRFGAYASNHGTNGFIPSAIARSFGTNTELRKLLEATLIERTTGGYLIPDFLDYNPSAEEVKAQRERWAAKKREYREARNVS